MLNDNIVLEEVVEIMMSSAIANAISREITHRFKAQHLLSFGSMVPGRNCSAVASWVQGTDKNLNKYGIWMLA